MFGSRCCQTEHSLTTTHKLNCVSLKNHFLGRSIKSIGFKWPLRLTYGTIWLKILTILTSHYMCLPHDQITVCESWNMQVRNFILVNRILTFKERISQFFFTNKLSKYHGTNLTLSNWLKHKTMIIHTCLNSHVKSIFAFYSDSILINESHDTMNLFIKQHLAWMNMGQCLHQH